MKLTRKRIVIGVGIVLVLAALASNGKTEIRTTPTPTVRIITIQASTRAASPAPSATSKPTQTIAPTATELPASPTTVAVPTQPPTTQPPTTQPPTPAATQIPVVVPTDTIAPPPPQPANYDRNGDGQVTCADFSTQAEAQAAYNAGQTQLDGNDNDGRACESLP